MGDIPDKVNSVSLGHYELSRRGRQAISQSIENSTEYKKFAAIYLNALLGLVIPNQYCQGTRIVL